MKQAVIITGASQGIGHSITKTLDSSGYATILIARQIGKLNSLSKQCKNPCFPIAFDLGKNNFSKLFMELENLFSNNSETLTLKALINNAGIYNQHSFSESHESDWNDLFAVNFFAPLKLSQFIIPKLRLSPSGRIISVSSSLANRPTKFASVYTASKAALKAWSQSLAIELAPNITVNTISPGIINTPIHSWYHSDDSSLRQSFDDLQPLNTIGKPEDIASMVSYLMSEKANWITGSDFVIDGGISL